MTIDLAAYRTNKFSQHGEDGIIERILNEIGLETGFLVEFGAWDGKHLSNTYNLIQKGWSGCLIEGDEKRFKLLCENIPSPEIIKIRDWIRPSGPSSLDAILKRHHVDHVDLLSIDIDSDDLAIWESVTLYSPTIVIIEYNPTIPFDTRHRNPPGARHGNSALSILEHATKVGYALVAGTDTNLVFLKRQVFEGTALREVDLQSVRDTTFQLRYFFSYEGQLLHTYHRFNEAGVTELFPVPWAFTFATQPVPKILRRGPDRTSIFTLTFSLLTALLQAPLQLFRLARHMLASLGDGRSLGELLSMVMKRDKFTQVLKERADRAD